MISDASTIWPEGFAKPTAVASSSQSSSASTPSTPTTSFTATASVGSTDSSSSIAVTGSGNLASKPTQTADTSLELEFWQSIKDSDDPGMYRAYLEAFPEGTFVPLAKVKLKQLSGTTDVVASAIPDLNYGRYHALVIGNNDYDYLSDLKTAINDAEGVASLLKEDYGFEVSLLKNATRAETVKALSGFRKTVSSNDSLLIYYAGHGHLDEAADEGYWLPVDSSPDDPSNWLQNDTVVAQIRAMDAKHVMIVADSCFSGTLTRAIKIELRTPSDLQKIIQKKARTALTSGGLEPVLDSRGGDHSVFAKSFISLLEENPGVLDAHQLFSSIRTQVALNSSQIPEYGNIHEAGHDGGDFLFVKTAKISVEPATASSIEKPTVQAVPNNAAEVAFWQSIEDSDDQAMFQAYLEQYPNGEFVVLAKIKLEKLKPAAQSIPKGETYFVEVRSQPVGADVYIDDVWEGITPLSRALGGRTTIRVEKDGYGAVAREFNITEDQTITFELISKGKEKEKEKKIAGGACDGSDYKGSCLGKWVVSIEDITMGRVKGKEMETFKVGEHEIWRCVCGQ